MPTNRCSSLVLDRRSTTTLMSIPPAAQVLVRIAGRHLKGCSVAPRVPVNDLSRGWLSSSPEVTDAVRRVITSGRYVHGPEHNAFEDELATFMAVEHVIGVATGTDALALSLLGVGCDRAAEVVVAANAGGYGSIAAASIGCSISYADVDQETLLVTAETLEPALTQSTRAVIVTHLYGNVAEIEPILDLCRGRGIAVVEDCAQAIGARLSGQRVGTFGDVAAISFYPTKNLGAAGDGGVVVTHDAAVARKVRRLRQYGWSERYVIAEKQGRNSRLDELQAAVLRVGLPLLDDLNRRRIEICAEYTQAVTGTAARMVTGASRSSVAHLAVLRVPHRAQVRARLADLGVGTDIHYPVPDHRQPGLPPTARPRPLPVTEVAANEVLSVPCFPELTSSEVRIVAGALREVLAT